LHEAVLNFQEELDANESSGRHLVYRMSSSPADIALGIKTMTGKNRNKLANKFSEFV